MSVCLGLVFFRLPNFLLYWCSVLLAFNSIRNMILIGLYVFV